jgi:hypothetical protein
MLTLSEKAMFINEQYLCGFNPEFFDAMLAECGSHTYADSNLVADRAYAYCGL